MSITDTAKRAYDLAKKGMTVEFQEEIMELREEALELQEENLRLKQENRELKEEFEWKKKLHRKKSLYWVDDDDTPFCPYCWERNGLAIHLTVYPPQGVYTRTECTCQECKIRYTAKGNEDFAVTRNREE
jgi:hypothetical protein